MTREDAFAKKNEEVKLTHRFFEKNEWVMLKNGEYIFDDGQRQTAESFWLCRNNDAWDIDWEFK